jgi:hypothetical protein
MSQHVLDLRRSMQNVRRHRKVVVYAAALGLVAGAAFTMLNPPMLGSAALVEFPPLPARDIQTQVVIASSDPVLASAMSHIDPAVSLETLHDRVRVTSVTPDTLKIDAQGTTVAQATGTANAVAAGYISYIRMHSPGIPDAWLLEPATSATGTPLAIRLLGNAGIGALLGVLAGTIIALAVGRSDRRLWGRDEIADATGVPVLASISVRRPADVAGWRRLVESYEPSGADGWSLRMVLHRLGVTSARGGVGTSVAVVTLSSDPGALALGPQLGVFAASSGITTALVIGQLQDKKAAAMLRAAYARAPNISSERPGNLLVTIGDGQEIDQQPRPALTVVVDGQGPQLDDMMRTTAAVLAVSAGAATAEQLARLAVSVANHGRDIVGIIVGNPVATDHTTGRYPEPTRQMLRTRPTRLPGVTLEARR